MSNVSSAPNKSLGRRVEFTKDNWIVFSEEKDGKRKMAAQHFCRVDTRKISKFHKTTGWEEWKKKGTSPHCTECEEEIPKNIMGMIMLKNRDI